MIIEHIAGIEAELNLTGKTVHPVEFTEEQMQKGHQRFLTQDGLDVAISLPSEEHLADGSILELPETDVILVRAAVEKVFVITPRTAGGYGKVCYNIGNMHKKAYLTETEVVVPYDSVLERVLIKCKEPYQVTERRITGISANVSAKEHAAHGHEHEHKHEHHHG